MIRLTRDYILHTGGKIIAGGGLDTFDTLYQVPLWGYTFENCDFSFAKFGRSAFVDCIFKTCNFQCSTLDNVALYGKTKFIDCDVKHTCFDPKNTPNKPECGVFRQMRYCGQAGVVGYRTAISTFYGHTFYRVGLIYTAPLFSTSSMECHPGLYLYPRKKDVVAWLDGISLRSKGVDYVKVWTKRSMIHCAGGKYRCREFMVLG